MKKILTAAAVAVVVAAPGMASAYKVYGDAVEIFGTLHVSLDYIDQDGGRSNLNVASNSSNIGVRGVIPLEDTGVPGGIKVFYHSEHLLNLDDGNGSWGGRDNFVGVDTALGKISFGYISTPYKNMGIAFTKYVTTAADPFVILGSASDNSFRLDKRSKNGIQWQNSFADVDLKLMYSTGMAADQGDNQDNNDFDMWNASAIWKGPAGLRLGAAFAKYNSNRARSTVKQDVTAYRLGASYSLGPWSVGAIFEDVDSDDFAAFNRRVYGANIGFNITSKTNIGAQWMHAEASDVGNDKADQIAVVLNHSFSRHLSAYALYSTVRNGDAAQYNITGYGHDSVKSNLGGDPQVISVGGIVRF